MGPVSESIKSPCTVMMVAEKPSIALSITEALCGKNFEKRTGPAKGIPIYTFKGYFKGHQANFKVTSVAGHVYNRDFPINYQDRRKDPVVLFDAPTIRLCDKRAKPVAKHLQLISKNADFIVLWLDCDKEGENICFEVLDICKRNIPNSKKVQRVYRAKFSSIAHKDIVAAFEGLKHGPNYNESISVDAR
jgi:DNA topoisomerase-3